MCLPCCVRVVQQGSLVIIIFIGLKIMKKKKEITRDTRWNTRVSSCIFVDSCGNNGILFQPIKIDAQI